MAIKTRNTEVEFVLPQAANFIRSVTSALTKQLKREDTADLDVPTLLSRAKSIATQDSFIMLLTEKDSGQDE